MTERTPPESLDDAIANASEAVAQQSEADAAKLPVLRRWRTPPWVAPLLVAAAAVAVYWSATRSPIPVEEERAAQEATLDQVRARIEAFRDSTGLAPDSLSVIGFGFLPASYVRTDSQFRLAIQTSDRDSLTVEGPARRAQP